jgi:hypothetical protein
VQLAPWPDAEDTVMALLDGIAPTYTATPATLTMPLITVQRVGGADDGITDYPRVQVTVYGSTRPQAWELAEACRQVLLAAYNTTASNGALIDRVSTVTPASQLPDPNQDARRVMAIYQVEMRRPRT